jgi:hypothetical protein
MKSTTLIMIATTALLAACSKDNSPAAPAANNNTGLDAQTTTLSSNDLKVLALADQQERMTLPMITDRSDNQLPDLKPLFVGVGDLSVAAESLNSECAVGEMNVKKQAYRAVYTCGAIQGTAVIDPTGFELKLQLTGAKSKADLHHLFLMTTANGDLTITKTVDDRVQIAEDSFVIAGDVSILFKKLVLGTPVDVEVSGGLKVTKNGGAADLVSVSSVGVHYIASIPSAQSKFCDGYIVYQSSAGLKRSFVLPSCPAEFRD